MTEKKYQFTIVGANEQECADIAKALNIIYKHIDKEHLKWVANKLKEDPKIIQKVIKISDNPIVKAIF
jgi:hypothetical protein